MGQYSLEHHADKERIVFDDIDKYGPQSFERTYQFTTEELARMSSWPSVRPLRGECDQRRPSCRVSGRRDDHFLRRFSLLALRRALPVCVSVRVSLRFRPRPDGTKENDEIEITPDELDIEFYTERAIPLRDLAAEQIQLAIPMKRCARRAVSVSVRSAVRI